MNRGPIEIAELARRAQSHGQPPTASGQDEAAVPWTFNQVLQPIIFVLAFVVLVQIGSLRAKNADLEAKNSRLTEQYTTLQREHERMAKENDRLLADNKRLAAENQSLAAEKEKLVAGQKELLEQRSQAVARYDELLEATRKLPEATEVMVLRSNLQLQKLLNALRQVEDDQRRACNANLFVDHTERIFRKGKTVHDEHFRTFCTELQALSDEAARQERIRRIYGLTLAKAGIQDPRPMPMVVVRAEGSNDDLTEDEARRMTPNDWHVTFVAGSEIANDRNRRIVHNAIVDFCDGLLAQGKNVQSELISRMLDEMLRNPKGESLSEECRKLVADAVRPDIPEAAREQFVRQLYRLMIDSWKASLDKQEYRLIIWERLRSM